MTTSAEFESLGAEWDDLHSRVPAAYAYLTHTWLLTWWRCHASRRKSLRIILVRRAGNLVAIAPFMSLRGRFFGIPHRRIEFISMMHHAYSPLNCSGALDILSDANVPEAIDAVFEYLAQNSRSWDLIRLNPVPDGSRMLTASRRLSGSGKIHVDSREVFQNAVVETSGTWDNYLSGRSRQFRRHIRGYSRTIAHHGNIRLCEYRSIENLPGGFDALLSVERRSWKWQKGFRLDAPEYRSFYRELLTAMSASGNLRLFGLEVNGTLAAYDICLESHNRIESLKSSYDANLREISPGGVITFMEIGRFFEEKKISMNLLWGDLPYKSRWATKIESHVEVLLFHNGAYSRFLRHLYVDLPFYRLARFLWHFGTRRPFLRRLLEKMSRNM